MFYPSFGLWSAASLFWARALGKPTPPAPCWPAGRWCLAPGRAVSLSATRLSRLRVVQGRAWVTLARPCAGSLDDQGDRFLAPGDTLDVPAGARLVVEPLVLRGEGGAVWFDWDSGAGR
ncbi:DUF2917 domain-containing protein [Macromonas nakdongensis]|uniref:DUF2917 domain-containing protein n=1 Tax=Macromonas nakdongensis TaxID=1843082 RepID=UPI000C3344DA